MDVNETLLEMTVTTLFFGLLIIVATVIRFYLLLKKGEYRAGTDKDKLRSKFETTSYVPIIIIASAGLVLIIRNVVDSFQLMELESFMMGILCILLYYVMLFILPEQIVLLYCKRRFKSFNLDENGNLFPLGSGDKSKR